MRSRTLASGAVLLTIFGLSGIVLVQDLAGAPAPDAAIVEPETAEPVSRPASTPARVVESAGFPAVPAEAEQQPASAPTVTINGQPLESSWSPATSAVAEAETTVPDTRSDVALVPPRPIPRPEGLSLPATQPAQATDYEAITAAAYPQQPQPSPYLQVPQPTPSPPASQLVGPVGVVDGFLTYEERQRLAAGGAAGPNTDELVQVTGPNGETLWVYPDQATQFGYGRQARPLVSPFGIFYD